MKIEFESENQAKLIGYYHKVDDPKATIIINPATAIKIDYYKHIITHLNNENFNVFIWNYSCFGESRTQTLAGNNLKYSDLGRYEIPAALQRVRELAPDLPLYCIGHSVGAQQMGFVRNKELLDGLIVVAASAGYIPHMPIDYAMKAFFFFHIFAPITSKLCKYVPASRFNFMEDLPAPFVKEWGQWCREKELFFSPKYYGKIFEKDAYRNFNFPIHVIVADDDEICTEQNMNHFWKHIYSKKGIKIKTYKASEFPRKNLGHFGYFKKDNVRIWSDLSATLHQWVNTSK